MHCSKAAQQLQLYIDNRLSLDQMRKLEGHISTCTACRHNLFLLENITHRLQRMELIAEPAELTTYIMQRVALSPQCNEEAPYALLRPSLPELMAVVMLATIATFGFIQSQPSLRGTFPIGNGHDMLSLLFVNFLHTLTSINSDTLMLALWIIGTILGTWIAFVLAGQEVRHTEWFKAVRDLIP